MNTDEQVLGQIHGEFDNVREIPHGTVRVDTDLADLSELTVTAADIRPVHSLDALWFRNGAGIGITGIVGAYGEQIAQLESNVEYAQSRICEYEKRIIDLEDTLYKLLNAFTKHCNGEFESDIVTALWNVLDQ